MHSHQRKTFARRGTLAWPLATSAISHALVLWAISGPLLSWPPEPERAALAEQPLHVRVLDDAQLPQALRRPLPPDQLKTRQAPKPKPPEPEPPKPKPQDPSELAYRPAQELLPEQQPDQARFSGRQANRVEREQIKKGVEGSPQPMLQPPQPEQLRPPDPRPQARAVSPAARPSPARRPPQPEVQTPSPEQEQAVQAPEPLTERGPTEPDIVLPKAQRALSSAASPGQQPRDGDPTRGSTSPDAQALFPSLANTRHLSTERGDGGTFNALRDIDEGDRTLLNRNRSRYWTFFDRMKRQLQREWNPQREYNKRDPYRNVYGVKDRYTIVQITLNGDGSVQKLHLAQSSGLDFYDDEAIRALLAAAPFPNPPEGLKDEDGMIHIRYGFYLQISSGSSRFFRVR